MERSKRAEVIQSLFKDRNGRPMDEDERRIWHFLTDVGEIYDRNYERLKEAGEEIQRVRRRGYITETSERRVMKGLKTEVHDRKANEKHLNQLSHYCRCFLNINLPDPAGGRKKVEKDA